jgi:hypothetical protein
MWVEYSRVTQEQIFAENASTRDSALSEGQR